LAALPITTAVYSVLRDRLKPGFKFWFFALAGTLLSFGFFFSLNVENLLKGDLLLILSVFSAAFGDVEGGRLSRAYGGSRTMTWAVLLTLPVVIPFSIIYFSGNSQEVLEMSAGSWCSVSYLALVGQSRGMF